MSPNPRLPRSKESFIRAFRARAWLISGAALAGFALNGCAPVAQSILKGARLAAPAPHSEEITNQGAGQQDTTAESAGSGSTPVIKDLQKPLAISYITEVVDALEGSDALARVAPISAPSTTPSTLTETLDESGKRLTVSLSENEVSQLQESGAVEFLISPLPTGTSIAKITGRFHVIQQEQELIEEDEGFETELSVYLQETGLKGSLRTRESPLTHFETASTLSRLIRVELLIELDTLGPILTQATHNATTAEVAPSR